MQFPTKSFAALMIVGVSIVVTSAQEKEIKREELPPAVEKTIARESEGATIKLYTTRSKNWRVKDDNHRRVADEKWATRRLPSGIINYSLFLR